MHTYGTHLNHLWGIAVIVAAAAGIAERLNTSVRSLISTDMRRMT